MKNAKKNPDPTLTSEKKKEWLDFIYEDRNKCVIPVGPRFQADIPDWTHSQKVQMVRQYKENKADTSKWLGTPTWPANNNLANKKVNEKLIGKGRDEHCRCESPGSVECVKSHVKEERMKLKSELGRAFSAWKFDEMGEEVSNLWTNKEQRIFTSLVQMNRMSKGKSFMKPALTYLPSKNRQSIVNYYFNVHVPQRISSQTRSNCHIIDTDDEEGEEGEEEEEDEEEFNTSKRSQKRNRAQKGDSSGSKPVKRKYLSGRR